MTKKKKAEKEEIKEVGANDIAVVIGAELEPETERLPGMGFTEAEIQSRYQAFINKTAGGK